MTSTEDKANIQNMESNIKIFVDNRKKLKYNTPEEYINARKLIMQRYYQRNREKIIEKNTQYRQNKNNNKEIKNNDKI